MYRVQVLMSTYNGERYLKEQIDSIIKQKDVEVSLLIRDDGSKDNTAKILEEYGKFSNISVIYGANLGATRSFFELIRLSGDFDYYSFADQDDVWDEDKLICAVSMLKEHADIPCVYSSNTRIVDDKLKEIRVNSYIPHKTLGSAIVKNYATGCTVVFNFKLMNYLKMYQPINAPYHDWWVLLTCLSINGISIYDEQPHISYRQHDNNVVGGNASFFRKWKSRLSKFLSSPYHRDIMAAELLEIYGKYMSATNKAILESISSYKAVKEIRTGNTIDDFLFRICLLLRKI